MIMKNVGSADKTIRLLAGIALIGAPFLTSLPLFDSDAMTFGTAIVGVVLVATAVMNFCPLYRLFGIRTCKL